MGALPRRLPAPSDGAESLGDWLITLSGLMDRLGVAQLGSSVLLETEPYAGLLDEICAADPLPFAAASSNLGGLTGDDLAVFAGHTPLPTWIAPGRGNWLIVTDSEGGDPVLLRLIDHAEVEIEREHRMAFGY